MSLTPHTQPAEPHMSSPFPTCVASPQAPGIPAAVPEEEPRERGRSPSRGDPEPEGGEQPAAAAAGPEPAAAPGGPHRGQPAARDHQADQRELGKQRCWGHTSHRWWCLALRDRPSFLLVKHICLGWEKLAAQHLIPFFSSRDRVRKM